jgi:hypothetical protein
MEISWENGRSQSAKRANLPQAALAIDVERFALSVNQIASALLPAPRQIRAHANRRICCMMLARINSK